MNPFESLMNAMMPVPDTQIEQTASLLMSEAPKDKIEIDQKLNDKYRRMIKNAEAYQKSEFYEKAKRFMDYYRGVINQPNQANKKKVWDLINVNEFWVNVQTLGPSLYFQNPKVAITAEIETVKKPIINPMTGMPEIDPQTGQPAFKILDCQVSAKKLSSIIDKTFKRKKLKSIASRIVTDSLISWGVIKFGWQTEVQQLEQDDIKVISDDLVVERMNPLNVLIDPECTSLDLSDAKYIVLRYHKPTEVIKNNPNYVGVANLKGSKQLMFSGDEKLAAKKLTENLRDDAPDVERNILFELYDKVNGKLITYVDTLDHPIRYADRAAGFPIKILAYNEDPESVYPIPDFQAYESLVVLKNKLRRKMVDLFNKLNRIFLVDSEILSKDTLQDALDGDTGAVVPVKKTPAGKSISDAIFNVNDFVMNESYLALQRIIDADIERVSGISDFQRGLLSETKRTATEMLNVSSQMNLRVEKKKDTIAMWLEEVIMEIIKLLQENADEKQIVRISGDDGVEYMPWSKEDIEGEYAVSIDVGSMVKQNPEVRSKEVLEQYNVYKENPLVDQVAITKEALKATNPNADVNSLMNKMQVEMYKNPQPPKDDKTKASISYKLESADLLPPMNPNVLAILDAAGVQMPPQEQVPPSQLPPIPEEIPQEGVM